MMHDFESILRSTKPVYVVNNTDPRGLLICTVTDPTSGRPHKLQFPRTWIPFCLTDMIPRETLTASIDLREMVSKGILRVIDEKEAKEILNSPKGKKEYDRLFKSQFSVGGAGADKAELAKATEMARQQNLENPELNREAMPLHPKIKAWEQRVAVGELTGDGLATELEIHGGEFALEDLQYLLAGQFPQEAKDFAYEALRTSRFRSGVAAQAPVAAAAKKEEYVADWE